MSDQVKKPGEQRLHYNIKKRKTGQFDIIHGISENFTLVQLMASVGNFNHAVSIFRYWIFDSNHKKVLLLTLYSLNIIRSYLILEGMFSMFETVF